MFALPQQQMSKKMCYLRFSVEKFAHVTCMLGIIHCIALQTFCFNQNVKYCFILLVSPYSLMQDCTPECRTNFLREATTRDSKWGQSRNTVIRDPRILCNHPHPHFKISGSALILISLKVPENVKICTVCTFHLYSFFFFNIVVYPLVYAFFFKFVTAWLKFRYVESPSAIL